MPKRDSSHGTVSEVKFLRGLSLAGLKGYKQSMAHPRNWGSIDAVKIAEVVNRLIAKAEGRPLIVKVEDKPTPKPPPVEVERPRVGAWKCQKCEHVGPAEAFGLTPAKATCPKCGESDDIFPYRMYRCVKCGKIAEQEVWFPELGLDNDPLQEKIEAEACGGCVDKFDQEQIGVTPDLEEEIQAFCQKITKLAETPAELEEVPVKIPAAY